MVGGEVTPCRQFPITLGLINLMPRTSWKLPGTNLSLGELIRLFLILGLLPWIVIGGLTWLAVIMGWLSPPRDAYFWIVLALLSSTGWGAFLKNVVDIRSLLSSSKINTVAQLETHADGEPTSIDVTLELTDSLLDINDCMRMIDQMRVIYVFDSDQFADRFKEIQAKVEGPRDGVGDPWVSVEVRKHFERHIEMYDLGLFPIFLRLISIENLTELNSEDRTEIFEKIGSRKEISAAIEWAISDSDLPQVYKLKAVTFLDNTYKIIEYEFSKEFLEQLHWSSLLLSWSSITFWRREPSSIRSRTLEIGQNAFVSRVAESDPFLFPPGQADNNWTTYTSQPPKLRAGWYEELRRQVSSSRAIFVAGAPGFGKTAAALMLAWDELLARPDGVLLPSSTLPIYCPYRIDSVESFLRQFARIYAKTLMGYLAATPYDFLQSPTRNQSAMAMLLVCCLGPGDELRSQFLLHRIRRTPMSPRFFDVLRERTKDVNPERMNLKQIDTEQLLALLFEAIPNSVVRRLPIIDIQSSIASGAAVTTLPYNFLTEVELLTQSGMGSTIFLPLKLANQSLSPTGVIFPVWIHYEIRQLLENRLSSVTRMPQYDLSVFCDFRGVDSIEDIQDRLIEESQMLPGRLIEIVQRFIQRIEQTNSLLDQDAIDNIFDSFA